MCGENLFSNESLQLIFIFVPDDLVHLRSVDEFVFCRDLID